VGGLICLEGWIRVFPSSRRRKVISGVGLLLACRARFERGGRSSLEISNFGNRNLIFVFCW